MAKLIQLLGAGPVNEAERLVVAALVRELPDPYAVIPNVELVDRRGQRLECDVIVAAPHAVYLVETKGWLGAITGDDQAWLVNGTARPAPIRLTAHKARVLKGRLADELPILNQAWVEPVVALAFRPRSLVLTEEAQRWALDPPDLVRFIQDPDRLPHRGRPDNRLVERVVEVLRGNAVPRSGPQAFHEWQVVEMLETDGLVTEYRAVHKMAPSAPPARLRVVALSPYMLDPAELERHRRALAREFRALRRMGPHQNVAAAQDVFDDDAGNFVIVSEEIEGQSLAMALDQGLDMSDDQKLGLLRQVARAVQHAHQHDVIHRRVTPENVIRSPAGVVRLTGFGHARIAAEGTVYLAAADIEDDSPYAAPELVDPRIGKVGEASDLYGAGAIAWALWAGEPPTPGRSVPVGMPAVLRPVVSGLVALAPAERTGTVQDLLDAIDRSGVMATPTPLPSTGGGRAPIMFQPSDLIEERYEIKGVLGAGAFSTVYRVYDTVILSDFALKVFGPTHGLGTVQRELRALLGIRHPNVVVVRDADRTTTVPRQWFLISEYVEGSSLADFGAHLPLVEAISVVAQLLGALMAFHPDATRIAELKAKGELTAADFDEMQQLQDSGVVHRDVKPQNIIYRPDGQIKLVDFNIASAAGDAVLTVAGTPRYQPPDPDLTLWAVDTDLFASGVVLYELVTGSHPYPDARPVSGAQPIDACSIATDVPEALGAFLGRACAAERSRRFATAVEMREALRLATAIELPIPPESDVEDPDQAVLVTADPLPTGHHHIGWLHTADFQYPLVTAEVSPPEGRELSVLSAVTQAGDERYPAPEGSQLWLPGGQALGFESIVNARWELFERCCLRGVETVVAEQLSLTEWRFRHGHPTLEDAESLIEFRVVDRDGSAWVTANELGPPLLLDHSAIDLELEQFIQDCTTHDEDAGRRVRSFAEGALARGDVTLQVRPSSSRDRSDYAVLKTKAIQGFGAVGYVWPGLSRVDLRVPKRRASGWTHAEAPRARPGQAFLLRIGLTSDAAVAEALEILGVAVEDTLSTSGAKPGRAMTLKAASDQGSAVQAEGGDDLERAFHLALIEDVKQCRKVGYNPDLFTQLLAEQGGVTIAKALLHASEPSAGFITLRNRSRLELTVEAIVLRPEFTALFTDEERAIARRRIDGPAAA